MERPAQGVALHVVYTSHTVFDMQVRPVVASRGRRVWKASIILVCFFLLGVGFREDRAVDRVHVKGVHTVESAQAATNRTQGLSAQQWPRLKPILAICTCTAAVKDAMNSWTDLKSASLQTLLIPSIENTVNAGDLQAWEIRLYLGIGESPPLSLSPSLYRQPRG